MNSPKIVRGWFTVCVFLHLAACVPALHAPVLHEPQAPPPDTFGGDVSPGSPGSPGLQGDPILSEAQATWNGFFASRELRELIGVALADNRELNIRLQELVIRHNEVDARRGDYLPKINGAVGAGIDKVSRYTSQGASDDATRLPSNLGNFTFGLVGSWEADIWAKLRNAKKAADLRYLASVEGQRFLVTQTVAELARGYYELLALDNQLLILAKNIQLQEESLAMVQLEKQAARVTELAVQRFEAELLRYKSRVCALTQQRVQTENRLNFLAGRYPQAISRNPMDLAQPPQAALQTGLPAQLLENRTDVREAHLALAAAKLDVKSAKAAFYPSLTLEAGVGYRAFNAAHLLATPASLVYDAVGGLVAPLLNKKAIAANYRSANAMQTQAVLLYERTLLQAYTDVVNQLAGVKNWGDMLNLLQQEVDTLEQAVDTSRTLFQAARAEYIEVLTTRRDYLEAQIELIEARKQRFLASVNMYQALGGGWRTAAAVK